jgi:3-hydroxyisobutyrate dehydrogenase-like beta-hydroxyacid dehydrogenase
MTPYTVGIMAPGEMGHAIGRVLRLGGLRVITCLQGRSARTAARAAAAGIEVVADDLALVREADILLSIVAPAHARTVAERMAAAVRATGAALLYADCNAVAPETSRALASLLLNASARYVDAGIIGGPPVPGGHGPRIYVSGQDADGMLPLREHGLDIRVVGTEIGQASGLKLCYAMLTKGLTALATEALVAGRALGLHEALQAELRDSQRDLLAWIDRSVPGMPAKAWRWVGEMEEIAAMFESMGLPPALPNGAAALYRFVSQATPDPEAGAPPPRDGQADGVTAWLAASLAASTEPA